MNKDNYTNFSEEVFNRIDNAKIDEVEELEFKVGCAGDLVDTLTELIKYTGNNIKVKDHDDKDFFVTKLHYNVKEKQFYLEFSDEEE